MISWGRLSVFFHSLFLTISYLEYHTCKNLKISKWKNRRLELYRTIYTSSPLAAKRQLADRRGLSGARDPLQRTTPSVRGLMEEGSVEKLGPGGRPALDSGHIRCGGSAGNARVRKYPHRRLNSRAPSTKPLSAIAISHGSGTLSHHPP
jgi:hypothetical protein